MEGRRVKSLSKVTDHLIIFFVSNNFYINIFDVSDTLGIAVRRLNEVLLILTAIDVATHLGPGIYQLNPRYHDHALDIADAALNDLIYDANNMILSNTIDIDDIKRATCGIHLKDIMDIPELHTIFDDIKTS